MPTGAGTNNLLYYNKMLFNQAGFDQSKPPQTWPELRSMAQKFTRRRSDGNIDQLSIVPEQLAYRKFFAWAFSNGGSYASEDTRTFQINSENNHKTTSRLISGRTGPLRTLVEGPKEIPIVREVDVLVAGGGPAGIAAAVAAARAGVSVLLVEKNGWPGGMATAGLVNPFMPSYAGDQPAILGIFGEVVSRLVDLGAAIHPAGVQQGSGYAGHCYWPHAHVTPFDPEIIKWVIGDLIREVGVELLLHSYIVDTLTRDNKVQGVIVETKSGRMALKASIVVDATGDADIAQQAGATYAKGRPSDGLMQPVSVFFRLAKVDRARVDRYIKDNPEERHFQSLAKIAKEHNEFIETKHDVLCFYAPREDEVVINATRVHQIDGTNVWELTSAEIQAREQVRILVNFFRKYVPGFENAVLTCTAEQVGVRETRRIVGEYVLNEDDLLTARQFPDSIAQCAYMIDIHSPTGSELHYKPIPAGLSYGIPYRCLLPMKIENLLVAGRCISALTPDYWTPIA